MEKVKAEKRQIASIRERQNEGNTKGKVKATPKAK